jgi:hypothetical protein
MKIATFNAPAETITDKPMFRDASIQSGLATVQAEPVVAAGHTTEVARILIVLDAEMSVATRPLQSPHNNASGDWDSATKAWNLRQL